MNRSRIFDNLTGTGKPSDWKVPDWNRPAAQEFMRAQAAVKQSLARLAEIEAALDARENLAVCEETGEGYEPTDARRANTRFTSSEWQQTWQELTGAVEEAKKWETQWRAETAKRNERHQ